MESLTSPPHSSTLYSTSKQVGNNKVRTRMTTEKHYLRKRLCETDVLKMALEPRIIQSQRKEQPVEFSPLTLCLNDREYLSG